MFKFLFTKVFIINLLLSFCFAGVVIWGIFKFLDSYTHHGETISVPTLEGLTIEEVKASLEEKKLRYEILDSIYVADAEKGVVLEQNPKADDLVKENRTIYITVTKMVPPKIAMPDVVDMSLRLAVAKLESYGLKVGNPKYIPSECVSCVLEQEFNGKTIKPNTPIGKGTLITLVVGSGTSNEKVLVPYLINLTLDEAKQQLLGSSLNPGFSNYENCKCVTKEDTLKARIYRQDPVRSKNIAVNMGSVVDLYFTCDTNLIDFNPPTIDSTELDPTIKNN
ncbi:MAG: PASTA domain-containing protein [Vicingus serpentipes]|nr:PASTA domain-containing protein [Vicingus serpentipes]